jgi:hypothetical protein
MEHRSVPSMCRKSVVLVGALSTARELRPHAS